MKRFGVFFIVNFIIRFIMFGGIFRVFVFVGVFGNWCNFYWIIEGLIDWRSSMCGFGVLW